MLTPAKWSLQIQPKSDIALEACEVRIIHPHGTTGTHAVDKHVLVLDDVLAALQGMLVADAQRVVEQRFNIIVAIERLIRCD
ncbi:hypothetical protein IKQ19_11355, partial [Candidatus Saccharibacteria bacterium]|nr:hypothetical protein [Candidatus Saccharibacteria bacterium]